MRYIVKYLEVKEKKFNKSKTMHKFLYGKKSPVFRIVDAFKKHNNLLSKLDLITVKQAIKEVEGE